MSAEQLPCTVRESRAAMTDDEFWEDVAGSMAVPYPEVGFDDEPSPDMTACPECGEIGACAYDAEGRPMIHTTDQEDE